MFYSIIQQSVFFIIPLLLVALGGMYSERSGTINIALEGIMIMGAFGSIFFISIAQANNWGIPPQLLLIIAILIAAAVGGLYALLLGYASIHLKADQVIGGTALNMLAPAVAIFAARMLQPSHIQQITFENAFRIEKVPLLGDIPLIGDMFFQNTYITTFIGIAILIITAVIFKRTKFGLRLGACGEHPQAADSVGINVYKMRYIGVLISGMLGGIGGLVFIIPTSVSFSGDVAGYGFLALAVMIFGQWRPYKILFAACFFGFAKAISSMYDVIPLLANLFPSNVYKMLPYIATMVVLGFTSRKSKAPKAEGIPYDKGAR